MAESFLTKVALEEEATKGTAGTSPDQYLYCTDALKMDTVQTLIKNEVVQGRDLVCVTPSSYHMDIGLPLIVTPENIGWLLKFLMGDVSSTQQGATSAYLHEFTPSDSLKSFTTWAKYGDVQQVKVNYCTVNEMDLTQSTDDSLRASFSIIGQQDVITSDFGTESYETVCPFGNQHLTVSIGGSTSGQASEVHNTSLKVSNGINADSGKVHGSRFYKDLVPGKRSVTGSLDMYFENDSEMQMFWGSSSATGPEDNLTSQAIVLTWDFGQEAGTGYNYKMEVTIPAAYYETTSRDVGGDRVVQTISFLGKYDTAATNAISIDLINQTTDYVL